MKKRMVSLTLALLLALTLLVPVSAESAALFPDVAEDAWYAGDVARAFSLGLVRGKDDGRFDPLGSVTAAETMVLACRLSDRVRGEEGEYPAADPWYQPYVDAAVSRGILAAGTVLEYSAAAPRWLFASLLCAALPAEQLEPVNAVELPPDVPEHASYAAAVLRLYRAGILKGNDEFGTFAPESPIQRCQMAAIVNRMADPSQRVRFTLSEDLYSKLLRLAKNEANARYRGIPARLFSDLDGDSYYLFVREEQGEVRLYAAVTPVVEPEGDAYELTVRLRLQRGYAPLEVRCELADGGESTIALLSAERESFTQKKGRLAFTALWREPTPLETQDDSSVRRTLRSVSEYYARTILSELDAWLQIGLGEPGVSALGYQM
ncbi:MAG: S-layer homology domain-containing protein [Oscillospiraceae bacterium]|nr:S-layer homology domain-containing protein [Oscillospiraceae bacterium]